MERYMLPLRILVTLLILAMLLPGWGLLSASSTVKEPATNHAGAPHTDTIGTVAAFDR